MADTIGDLVDKLTIANIRVWMLEDERRAFVASGGEDLEQPEMLEMLDKISKTNRERNNLIDQINAGIGVLIKGGNLELDAEALLGLGKNKFYKEEDR